MLPPSTSANSQPNIRKAWLILSNFIGLCLESSSISSLAKAFSRTVQCRFKTNIPGWNHERLSSILSPSLLGLSLGLMRAKSKSLVRVSQCDYRWGMFARVDVRSSNPTLVSLREWRAAPLLLEKGWFCLSIQREWSICLQRYIFRTSEGHLTWGEVLVEISLVYVANRLAEILC